MLLYQSPKKGKSPVEICINGGLELEITCILTKMFTLIKFQNFVFSGNLWCYHLRNGHFCGKTGRKPDSGIKLSYLLFFFLVLYF